MTFVLVIVMFLAFIVVDYFIHEKTPKYVLRTASRAVDVASKPHPFVAGYEIPERLLFHQGHAWALGEGPHLVRTGIDDFAAKLIGTAEEVHLPQRGQWVRQGQKVWSFRVNNELIEMVSPIEGTVSDVNDEVVRHPETLTADPYGGSWLMTVQAPDTRTNFRNLLSGSMVRNLINENAKKLASYIPASAGNLALAQDGGQAHGEIAKQLPAEKYLEITKEFFLT